MVQRAISDLIAFESFVCGFTLLHIAYIRLLPESGMAEIWTHTLRVIISIFWLLHHEATLIKEVLSEKLVCFNLVIEITEVVFVYIMMWLVFSSFSHHWCNTRPHTSIHRINVCLCPCKYQYTVCLCPSVFSARCNIYISRLCYDVSVCPSVCDGSALAYYS